MQQNLKEIVEVQRDVGLLKDKDVLVRDKDVILKEGDTHFEHGEKKGLGTKIKEFFTGKDDKQMDTGAHIA